VRTARRTRVSHPRENHVRQAGDRLSRRLSCRQQPTRAQRARCRRRTSGRVWRR
jgi:hypothetical protein